MSRDQEVCTHQSSILQSVYTRAIHTRPTTCCVTGSSEHGPATTPSSEWELGKGEGGDFPWGLCYGPNSSLQTYPRPCVSIGRPFTTRRPDRTGRHSANHCPQFYAHAKAIERFTRKSIFVGSGQQTDRSTTHTHTHTHTPVRSIFTQTPSASDQHTRHRSTNIT